MAATTTRPWSCQARLSTPANDPRYDTRWKMPGYTGHINGVFETVGSTPTTSQRKAFYRNGTELDPTNEEPVKQAWRDPCNDPTAYKKAEPELLWPSVAQPHPRMKGNLSNKSSIQLGDHRFFQPVTHYDDVHVAPVKQSSLWTPEVDNKHHRFDLAHMSPDELKAVYLKMNSKIGDVKMGHVMDNLRLRFSAKLNTASNSNGYKLLKLFQQHDATATGFVQAHHFVDSLKCFGLQLPEEVEIALFSRFDTDMNGMLDYKAFVAALVEEEYISLGFSSLLEKNDPQSLKTAAITKMQDSPEFQLQQRFKQLTSANSSLLVKELFMKMDSTKNGKMTRDNFMMCLKKFNIVLTMKELGYLHQKFDSDKSGFRYNDFAQEFFPTIWESTLGKSMHNGRSLRNFKESC